jgi:hypothetical protein
LTAGAISGKLACMSSLPHLRPLPPEKPSLPKRAIDDVRFIRATMERAASFTSVPGWGGVLMGAVALLAAPIADRTPDRHWWLVIWFGAALLAILIGASDMAQKARAERESLLRGPGWRFAMALVPPLAAGALLTFVLFRAGLADLLPGLWLLVYGVAVVAAGTFSIRAVKWMGLTFMLAGAATLFAPASWGDACMAAGFGGIHVAYGVWIARANRG